MYYLLKKYDTDEAIAEYDAAILWYMQRTNMNPQQYADDLVSKLCKIADVYNEGILNDAVIKGVDTLIHRSLRLY